MPVMSAILALRFVPLPCAISETSLSCDPRRAAPAIVLKGSRKRHVSHQTRLRKVEDELCCNEWGKKPSPALTPQARRRVEGITRGFAWRRAGLRTGGCFGS